jgi:hypothetical protein
VALPYVVVTIGTPAPATAAHQAVVITGGGPAAILG